MKTNVKSRTRIPALVAATACTLVMIAVVGTGCGQGKEKLFAMYHERVSSVGDLTDEMVIKYIRTYRELRKNGQNYLTYVAKGPEGQKAGYAAIERAIKKGGFKSYAEFVKVNAKIAWAWNISQAQRGMQMQAGLQKWGQGGLDSGIATIRKHLADPNVPESTKAQLRKQIKDLEKSKRKLAKTYNKNMKWAEWAMNFTKPLTNKKDLAVIKRHQKGLMEVFTGMSRKQIDQVHEHLMKQLKIE